MKNLTEFESRKILEKYGFLLPRVYLAKKASSAVSFAGKIGYPVVLKVMSPDILHKSDSGCVKTGITNPEETAFAFSAVIKNALKSSPTAKIDGVLVEETLRGTELIIGAKQDPQFGPIVIFGLGGVFVEVMKDASIRLAPINRKGAKEMISEIKGRKILEGYRGTKPINQNAIECALLSASKMITETPDIKEMDINPLFEYICFLEILINILEWIKEKIDAKIESAEKEKPFKKPRRGRYEEIHYRDLLFSKTG